MSARLEKALAPAYWSRWIVIHPGLGRVGSVEKRGMGSRWYALDREGSVLPPARATRALAVEAVVSKADEPLEALRQRVRSRYPGGPDGAASDAYWGWWTRWQQASAAERDEMESCL